MQKLNGREKEKERNFFLFRSNHFAKIETTRIFAIRITHVFLEEFMSSEEREREREICENEMKAKRKLERRGVC